MIGDALGRNEMQKVNFYVISIVSIAILQLRKTTA